MGPQHSESIDRHLWIAVLVAGYFAGHHYLAIGETLKALVIFATSCAGALMFAVAVYLIGKLQEKSRRRVPRVRKQQPPDQAHSCNVVLPIRR